MDFELEHDLEPYVLQSAVRLGLQVAPKDRKTRLKDLSYHLGNLTNFIRKQNHASQEILSRSTISTQQSIDSLHSKVLCGSKQIYKIFLYNIQKNYFNFILYSSYNTNSFEKLSFLEKKWF